MIKQFIKKIIFFGNDHSCPVCSSNLRKFKPKKSRSNAICPICGALERHRLLWMYYKAKTNLFQISHARLLHVAPEPQICRLLMQIPNLEYVSIDLDSPLAMKKMDLTRLEFPDNYFDIILCNHVLEHIPDDKRAMSELHRVLKTSGWAILQVPIKGDITQESKIHSSAAERERLYGQSDHFRQYGRDYRYRLEETGFKVLIDSWQSFINSSDSAKYGLLNEDIYLCRKKNVNVLDK